MKGKRNVVNGFVCRFIVVIKRGVEMTEREALNWEPIRKFWRNNSGANWDELEAAIKEALAGAEGERQPERSDDRERSDREQEPDYYGLTSDHLWMSITKNHYNKLKPEFRMACYTTPQNNPQRTWEKPWVGLTDEDIALACSFGAYTTESTRLTLNAVARTIEAKLKEKNT